MDFARQCVVFFSALTLLLWWQERLPALHSLMSKSTNAGHILPSQSLSWLVL